MSAIYRRLKLAESQHERGGEDSPYADNVETVQVNPIPDQHSVMLTFDIHTRADISLVLSDETARLLLADLREWEKEQGVQ